MTMIEINLLPKSYQKKSFDFSLGKTGIYAIAAAAGIVLMLITITIYQNYQMSELESNIEKARQRAAMLERDIQLVDALSDVKNKVQMRMAAVERLDSHRSAWVRILEDVTKNVPEFVWLSRFEEKKIEKKEDKETKNKKNAKNDQQDAENAQQEDNNTPAVRPAVVEGHAFTLNALAAFMIKMMRSDYFDEVELVSTEAKTLQEKRAYNFVINCNVHYLSDEELRNMVAQVEQSGNKSQTTSHKKLN